MKIFISADIEGVTNVTHWNETEAGHAEAAIGRIRAPVGLNIEAVTAPEIALSILAEVVAARRGAALGTRAAPAKAAAA